MSDASAARPTKDDLLKALVTERRFWDALAAAVEAAGVMDRPGANNGAWTFKDMAAHLNGWRGVTLARFEAASNDAGPPPHPWPGDWTEESTVDAINAWFYDRNRNRPAVDVLAESAAQFEDLIATIGSMSAADLLTPGRFTWYPWMRDLPIGPALLGFSFTHLHTDHEPDIRAWFTRETGRELSLPPSPPTFGYGDS